MTHNQTNPCAELRRCSDSGDADQRILVEVRRRLSDSGYRSVGDLTCHVSNHQITLRGMVRSFYLKQVAQTLAASIDEDVTVNNLVKVAHQSGLNGEVISQGGE